MKPITPDASELPELPDRHQDHQHEDAHGVHGSHSHSHGVDFSELGSTASTKMGTRALVLTLAVLMVTSLIQSAVYLNSHSVGLLSDAAHNFGDALTAIPIGIAFWIGRRKPTANYTYGFGRAEDLSGLFVLLVVAISATFTLWEAISHLVSPQPIADPLLVALAGVIGFAGNEFAARYRIRVGRSIESMALVADGYHARTDSYTSLAVIAGATGAEFGVKLADPIVALAISLAIVLILIKTTKEVFSRLADSVPPEIVKSIAKISASCDSVLGVESIRARWAGHNLWAELVIVLNPELAMGEVQTVTDTLRAALVLEIPQLRGDTISIALKSSVHQSVDLGD